MADDSTSQGRGGMKCKNCMMPICSEECGEIHQHNRYYIMFNFVALLQNAFANLYYFLILK